MPTRKCNRIVVDIRKIAYAWFYYRNQEGLTVHNKPRHASVRGVVLDKKEYAWPGVTEYPRETVFERAQRFQLLDRWTPVFRCRLSAADVLEFSGDKAVSLWKTWCERQFNNKGTNANTTKKQRSKRS